MDSTKTIATCPSCGRTCEPGATWKGANYCRGAALLAVVERKHGLTTWELSQDAGMAYTDASRGLQKLREFGAVDTESEDRGDGSFRYRYFPANDPTAKERFLVVLHRVEAAQ